MSSSASIWMAKDHLADRPFSHSAAAIRHSLKFAGHGNGCAARAGELAAGIGLRRRELRPRRARGELRDARARRRIGIEILAQTPVNGGRQLRLMSESA